MSNLEEMRQSSNPTNAHNQQSQVNLMQRCQAAEMAYQQLKNEGRPEDIKQIRELSLEITSLKEERVSIQEQFINLDNSHKSLQNKLSQALKNKASMELDIIKYRKDNGLDPLTGF